MRTHYALAFAALLLAGIAASCAATDPQDASGPSVYSPPPQDPARIGLPPIYRPFFDELRDEGDWTLIEPYGWCFRPRVNFVAWRPYLDGWWEPSDYFGWIWNTNEPFGWVTYHYGSWFYDSYQGWVWQPAPVWGPAWVAWVEAGDYVGWAPLAPGQYDGFADVPGGVFTFAPARQLASRDVGQQSMNLTRIPETTGPMREIVNIGRANGVAFNRGPDFVALQRMGTPIPERLDAATLPRVKLNTSAVRPNESDLTSRTGRVLAEGIREWRAFKDNGVAPPPPPPAGLRTREGLSMPSIMPPAVKPMKEPGRQDSLKNARRPHKPAAPGDTASGSRREGPGGHADRDTTRDR